MNQQQPISTSKNCGLVITLEEETINREPEKGLKVFAEEVLHKTKEVLETSEETPVKHWMDITGPILRSGGKTVSVILSLGFVAIPLMVSGSPWVAPILAIGASAVAICSCLK